MYSWEFSRDKHQKCVILGRGKKKRSIEAIFCVHHEKLWMLFLQWMGVTCSWEGEAGKHCQVPKTRFSWSPFIPQWGSEFTEQLLSFYLSFPVLFLMVYLLALWFFITQRFQQVLYTADLYYRWDIKKPPKCSSAATSLHWPTARLKHNGFKLCKPLASFLPWLYFMLGKKHEAQIASWRWEDKT